MSVQHQIDRLSTAKQSILSALRQKGIDTTSVSHLEDISSLLTTVSLSPFRISDGFAVLTNSSIGTATTIEYHDSVIAIKEVN